MSGPIDPNDIVAVYGYERTPDGKRCVDCGATFPVADGSVMRSHARHCPVNPRFFHIPGVCWA